MANVIHDGPHAIDFGPQGLAPGQAISSHWNGWNPEPSGFTVTVTVLPATNIAGAEDSHAANTMYVSDTSVQYVPSFQGDVETDTLVIWATLANDGPAAIRWCSLYITFVTA